MIITVLSVSCNEIAITNQHLLMAGLLQSGVVGYHHNVGISFITQYYLDSHLMVRIEWRYLLFTVFNSIEIGKVN